MDIYLSDLTEIKPHPELIRRYEGILSPNESVRYQKMTDENRRFQFLTGRALIADICHQSPILLPNGKPTISTGHISLAHSGSYVVLAHASTPVGIDIEDTSKDKNFDKLANRLGFTLSSDKRTSFYRQFTCFEATFKLSVEQPFIEYYYYSINTFIICISTLNNNEKLNFVKIVPFSDKHSFIPHFEGQETQ